MAQCTICHVDFDGILKLCATPCGHVFHIACLGPWLNTNQSCPACRSRVTKRSVVKLYLNINSAAHDVTPDPALKAEVDRLSQELSESSATATRLMRRNAEIVAQNNRNEIDILSLKETNVDLEQQMRNCMNKIPVLKKRLVDSRAESLKLNAELQSLKDLKTVLAGTQQEAEEVLGKLVNSSTPDTEKSIVKRLAVCCTLTRRELKRTIVEKSHLKSEFIAVSKSLGFASSKLRSANDKMTDLRARAQEMETCISENKPMKNFCADYEPQPSTSRDTPCFRPKVVSADDYEPQPSTSRDTPCFRPKVVSAMTPITAGSACPPKRKMNVVVVDKEKVSVSSNQSVSPSKFLPLPKRMKEAESVSSTGYNGLGGHHSVINRADSPTNVPGGLFPGNAKRWASRRKLD